jgi:uncharacterized membrane protein
MTKGRLEAFSDGVIAILITIMVLELRVPHGSDLAALRPLVPAFLSYLLSFIYLAIYWNNHHHTMQAVHHVNGSVLWANLHLLFWLSLIPISTAWLGDNPQAPWPVACYGLVLLAAAIAYYIWIRTLLALHGADSPLAKAIGRDFKGKISVVLYAVAVLLAFVHVLISIVLYNLVAILWIVPDPRIERTLER